MSKRTVSDEEAAAPKDTEPQVKRPRKERLVWTRDLHARFLAVVTVTGPSVKPKDILHMMNVTGLSRQSVASHLQKYRGRVLRYQTEQAQSIGFHEPLITPYGSWKWVAGQYPQTAHPSYNYYHRHPQEHRPPGAPPGYPSQYPADPYQPGPARPQPVYQHRPHDYPHSAGPYPHASYPPHAPSTGATGAGVAAGATSGGLGVGHLAGGISSGPGGHPAGPAGSGSASTTTATLAHLAPARDTRDAGFTGPTEVQTPYLPRGAGVPTTTTTTTTPTTTTATGTGAGSVGGVGSGVTGNSAHEAPLPTE